MAKTTRRVQMDLGDQSYERLIDLKAKVEANSLSEVLKDALKVYEWIVDLDAKGAKFFTQEEGKPTVEVKIF